MKFTFLLFSEVYKLYEKESLWKGAKIEIDLVFCYALLNKNGRNTKV